LCARDGAPRPELTITIVSEEITMTTTTEETRVLIGVITVDSGTFWIGDPCYIKDVPVITARDGRVYADAWQDPRDRVDVGGEPVAKQFPHAYSARTGTLLGIVVSTPDGDGDYPVYARVADGMVESVTIEFLAEESPPADIRFSKPPTGIAAGPGGNR
jgi:hypothetical protein